MLLLLMRKTTVVVRVVEATLFVRVVVLLFGGSGRLLALVVDRIILDFLSFFCLFVIFYFDDFIWQNVTT